MLGPDQNPQLLLSGLQAEREAELLGACPVRGDVLARSWQKKSGNPALRHSNSPSCLLRNFQRAQAPQMLTVQRYNIQERLCSELENDAFYLPSTCKDVQGPLENFPNPSSSSSREKGGRPGAGGNLGLREASQASVSLRFSCTFTT